MPIDIRDGNLAVAHAVLMAPYGLDERIFDSALSKIAGGYVDFADLYVQSRERENWLLQDGIITSGECSTESGMSMRAVSGNSTAFASAKDISCATLFDIATNFRSDSLTAKACYASSSQEMGLRSHLPRDWRHSFDAHQKTALLNYIDAIARNKDARVKNVKARLIAEHNVVLVARNDSRLAADIRLMIGMEISVSVEQNGARTSGKAIGGTHTGYSYFTNDILDNLVSKAVNAAILMLDARPAPAGRMSVVLGPGWPGIILHEAVGHCLEGDLNCKRVSAFSDRLWQQVAARGVTIVDDGTIAGGWGSQQIDDEGTPTQCTILIEDGTLKGYMQDRMHAHLMNMAPTGNARRQSFAHLPMPRMTNTCMLAGTREPDEIIGSVMDGIYVADIGNGQVNITNGNFVFDTAEAYRIERGRITYPIRIATIAGNGQEILKRVSMIGRDFKLDSGLGVCGKRNQTVSVGFGQPTLRIDDMIVGGTAIP